MGPLITVSLEYHMVYIPTNIVNLNQAPLAITVRPRPIYYSGYVRYLQTTVSAVVAVGVFRTVTHGVLQGPIAGASRPIGLNRCHYSCQPAIFEPKYIICKAVTLKM